jgi:hypothetical protein
MVSILCVYGEALGVGGLESLLVRRLVVGRRARKGEEANDKLDQLVLLPPPVTLHQRQSLEHKVCCFTFVSHIWYNITVGLLNITTTKGRGLWEIPFSE